MDFRATSTNSIEFCDPLNPQFIPVVAVQSPVTMTLTPVGSPVPGAETRVTLTLKTASGKPIAPEDLLVTHTRLLHLLIIDPWLNDYQHVHPEPGARPGEWTFSFTPRREGRYRVFADFTPVVTARGLYASADMQIGKQALPASFTMVMQHEPSWVVERDGYRFALVPGTQPVRAREPVDLKLVITRRDGGPVPMQLVMGAFAHLVAFDEARSGFAHLHPNEINPLQPPDAGEAGLEFQDHDPGGRELRDLGPAQSRRPRDVRAVLVRRGALAALQRRLSMNGLNQENDKGMFDEGDLAKNIV